MFMLGKEEFCYQRRAWCSLTERNYSCQPRALREMESLLKEAGLSVCAFDNRSYVTVHFSNLRTIETLLSLILGVKTTKKNKL